MEITVAGQTWVFLGSLAVGALLGLAFDLLRITRLAFPLPGWVVMTEDLFFWLLASVFTFGYLMLAVEGQVRFFVLLGEGLGWVCYNLTLGSLLMASAARLIRAVKRLLHLLARRILHPLGRFFRWLWQPWASLFRQGAVLYKKEQAAARFRLKQRRILLYNLMKNPEKGKFHLRNVKKGGRSNGKAEKA